jgi:hypothetical protein
LTVGIVVLGVFLSPWYDLATKAAMSIF